MGRSWTRRALSCITSAGVKWVIALSEHHTDTRMERCGLVERRLLVESGVSGISICGGAKTRDERSVSSCLFFSFPPLRQMNQQLTIVCFLAAQIRCPVRSAPVKSSIQVRRSDETQHQRSLIPSFRSIGRHVVSCRRCAPSTPVEGWYCPLQGQSHSFHA